MHTKVIAQTIEQYGFDIEYVEMSYSKQFGALRSGLAHVQIEAWEPDRSETYDRLIAAQQILAIGVHDIQAREEWWYPKYVELQCPGLPDWRALNDCAHIFVDNAVRRYGTSTGTFFSGGWDNHDAEIIRSLNLDFSIKRVSGSSELWSTLKRFSENRIPIVLHNWTPNWTDKHIPGEFVKFPDYTPECEEDPTWGVNTSMTHDCANQEGIWIQKLIWPGLTEKYPCVYQFLQQVRFTQTMLIDTPSMIFIEGLTEDAAAEQWQTKYAAQLNEWLRNSCLVDD